MSDEVQVQTGQAGNKGEGEFLEYSRARQSMSRRIAESKATIPHIYIQVEADVTALVRRRAALRDGGDAPTVNDLVIKAAALALRNHPRVNGTYRDGGLQLHSRINIGVAVDTEDGSITPVITDADLKELDEIASEVRRLSSRARSGEITPPEQAGATFSISNLGMLGVNSSQPIVNPGQAAKLAVGVINSQPVVRGGEVVPGDVMTLDLSCDHRVLHGGEGARFLTEVKTNLENPGMLG
ncbi:MAG: 2-oxo acid dehydrogenase subunit E2 [Solirubrobacterales bacterium]|jgi:pyruvate dehydrogenase E2 component (dihydrolipoamide acetyltransferase)|nr:2-oxo acid dehydrogenase subunit E2 [Solirubrobacterales bacterium]